MEMFFDKGLFVLRCGFTERYKAKDSGFNWQKEKKRWVTSSPYVAFKFWKYADVSARSQMKSIRDNIERSSAITPILRYDLPYYPFQGAGIEFCMDQFNYHNRRALLCADEQGLGKTIEAIGVANELNAARLLVVCPASLRLNWAREIEKWHVHNIDANPILDGKIKYDDRVTNIVSYNLVDKAVEAEAKPDFIILDEIHYLKNETSLRTKRVLGNRARGHEGLVHNAKVILLSGTPTPNGKPTEIYPCLSRLAPDAISYMKYWTFVRQYCVWEDDGIQTIIHGAKNKKELFTRLRGSGFMLRRLKKDVLKDLPPKRYKMVVFPQTGETRKIVKQEQNFSVDEVMRFGPQFISGMPDLRKQMGVAKAPQCIEYIENHLKGGDDKVVVFCHHIEVVGLLEEALEKYGAVTIYGGTKPKDRQENVDRFQNDPKVRVFIGNEAAEEGITLTAAHDCMLVEHEWVPGKGDQRADRLHRIGQTEQVTIHLLVVEDSMDAKILTRAAEKAEDIEGILGI